VRLYGDGMWQGDPCRDVGALLSKALLRNSTCFQESVVRREFVCPVLATVAGLAATPALPANNLPSVTKSYRSGRHRMGPNRFRRPKACTGRS